MCVRGLVRPVGVVISKGSFLAARLCERDRVAVHADNAFITQIPFSLIEGPDTDRDLHAVQLIGSIGSRSTAIP